MTQNDKPVHLAIINISSFMATCPGAKHYYGQLIFSEMAEVNAENVHQYAVRYLGKRIDLRYEMTLDEAKALDKKENDSDSYQWLWHQGKKDTQRFNSIDAVIEAGLQKWKELGIDCPVISLYEGERFYKTIIVAREKENQP